ncbi:L,D-transpeptidase [Candidatus Cyanaurora vandensis]|uniref:L,D-transpeptidase family protein n=1 Tax=Candidatus Cyanaurora vandensis TaxID=2714958 RepID=UPI002580F3B8|nr:L,D-transpeptidase family protein [Candidatus Cyanaurora vandensis]
MVRWLGWIGLAFLVPVSAQVPRESTQAVVVVAKDWDQTQGQLYRFVRGEQGWVQMGEQRPVVLGQSGLAWGRGLHTLPKPASPLKKEGDGRAPAGIFSLGGAYGYGTKPLTALTYRESQPEDRCVDDSNSDFYNQIVPLTIPIPWTSAEVMRREDDLYRRLVVVNHNVAPAIPQGGSCIFMHLWRSPSSPTVGCTAMASTTMDPLLAWLDPESKPVLIQLPQTVYEQVQSTWNLPKLP